MVECGRDLTKSNEIWQISNSEEWQRATNGGTAMDDKESDSSNFGVTLVVSSKEKLVTAREVLATGPQPQPTHITVFITLMHIAVYSEEVELELLLLILVRGNWSMQHGYFEKSKYCCHWLLPALVLHGDSSKLSWVAKFWSKITLCQSSLSVWHCIAVRNLGGKRQQLCFKVQFCVLLGYLGVNETNS
ncbi:hypothetical protein CMV_000740 [Castanea mollissima]|uniref:Uncharacterized protein n=1 Tax=Castanea mollissima TaxID=60419 RepID=A0A8J4RYZ9_9ROSI|nr:hypothetical protein CMV_000740 [Castanea mollissima]